ncbi:hypothetical protein MMC17_005995 [Xylographa soralifera]|nr:hypothetical protein [Xylographa soralifera]
MKQPIQRLNLLVKSFPIELLQLILCALPDAVTLRAVVLSHPSFYRAFSAAKDLIPLQVLLNQIPLDLLPDALVVLRSSQLKPWSRERVQEFLAHYYEGKLLLMHTWTIPDAVSASVLYDDIAFFMANFTAMALAAHPVTGEPEESPLALTSHERSRIVHTFYRFELYCNLFRKYRLKDNRFSPEEQRSIFFGNYSPWENEQLGCVHDYLYRRMVTVFNEFAAHDIEWGEERVMYDTDDWYAPENAWKQGTLSLGLNYLRRLITAETYEERYQLLAPNHRSDQDFLHEGLIASNHEYEDEVELCEYSSDDERRLIHPPFLEDPDPGPVRAWRWAHEHEARDSFIFANTHRQLRKRGYVMWDLERLYKWDLFRTPWRCGEGTPFDQEQSDLEFNAMNKSFEERSKIWQRGGTGWWSEGDESKIVWKKQEPYRPRDDKPKWPY